jgi:uncharacterized membrane protein
MEVEMKLIFLQNDGMLTIQADTAKEGYELSELVYDLSLQNILMSTTPNATNGPLISIKLCERGNR